MLTGTLIYIHLHTLYNIMSQSFKNKEITKQTNE